MSPLSAFTHANTEYNASARKTYQDSAAFHVQQMCPGNPPAFSEQLMAKAKAAKISLDVYKRNGVIDEYDLENALCPELENYAISLWGIDRQARCLDVTGLIHEGDVWSLRSNPQSVFNTPNWEVAFKTRATAERFLRNANRGAVSLQGKAIQAQWSADKVAPRHSWDIKHTRILNVLGPIGHEFSSARAIDNFLRNEIQDQAFDFVSTDVVISNGRQRAVGLEFLEVHGQSRNAFKCIYYRIHELGLQHQLQVRFGPDPCNQI